MWLFSFLFWKKDTFSIFQWQWSKYPYGTATTINLIEPVCPNCQHLLETIPKAKKKCPHCGKYIYTYWEYDENTNTWTKKLRPESEWKPIYDHRRKAKEEWTKKILSPEYIEQDIRNIEEKYKEFWWDKPYKVLMKIYAVGATYGITPCPYCSIFNDKLITNDLARKYAILPLKCGHNWFYFHISCSPPDKEDWYTEILEEDILKSQHIIT